MGEAMRQIVRGLLLTIAWVGLIPSTANAGLVVDVTFGTAGSPMGDTVAGWRFRVSQPLAVSSLGFWDEGGDGLNHAHDVGLWNTSGDLLSSTRITNTATAEESASTFGRWMFNRVATVVLTPGDYIVAATYLDLDHDQARIYARTIILPGVTYVHSMQKSFTSRLEMPDQAFPELKGGIFGPNLIAVAAPETSTLAGAMLVSIAGLARLRWPRSRRWRSRDQSPPPAP